MKSVCFIIALLFVFSSAGAQRFYYIETSNLVDRLLKSRLEKSDQYVVSAPMGSEYTIRTKLESKDNSREMNIEIVLSDSLTQKEIFRTDEQFCFTPGAEQPQLMYSNAIRQFLQRRIGELMFSAQQDHAGIFRQELKPRKDKT